MTIQRQYSLPNCHLIVEGVGPDATTPEAMMRPVLSTVTHLECHFPGQAKPLVGGRDLLDNLATAISEYAQEFLSGVAHPGAHSLQKGKPRLVQFQRVDTNLHRLLVQPMINNPRAVDKKAIDSQTVYSQLDLTTVQLFDLVEAIDQLFADPQTVPDLGMKLYPLAKRYAVVQEPAGQRTFPVILGASGLVVAAAALFYFPIPQVKRPEPANAQTSATQVSPTALPSSGAPGAAPGSPSSSSPAPTESQTESSPSSSPSSPTTDTPAIATTTPESSTTPNQTTYSTKASEVNSSSNVEAELNAAPEITDPDQLAQVLDDFSANLYQSWDKKPAPTFNQDLIYRVGVNQQGEVLGYSFMNSGSLNSVDEIPLLDMLKKQNALQNSEREPIAQFRVVFKPNRVAEISPWHGWAEGESKLPSPQVPPVRNR